MASVWRLTLALTVAVLMNGSPTTATNTPVTCKAEYCISGSKTAITCNFHRNINNTKPGINVIRYPLLSSGTDEGKDVLRCVWQDSEDAPDCIVDEDYTFDYHITDQLTLKIPYATDKVAGLYTCHVIPPGDFYPHACDLAVTAERKSTPTNSVASEQHTTPRSDCAGSRNDTVFPDNSAEKTSALIATVCLASLLTLMIALLIVYIIFRRHSSKRNDTKDFTEEENQDSSSVEITPLMTEAKFRQESDISPNCSDAGIQANTVTDSHDAQTDFSSSPKSEKVPNTPVYSRHNNVPLPVGLRKRGTWDMKLPSDNHSLDREKQEGVQLSCVQVTVATQTADTVSRADAAVQVNSQQQTGVGAEQYESSFDPLKTNGGKTSDETIAKYPSSNDNSQHIETEHTRNQPNAARPSREPPKKSSSAVLKWFQNRIFLPSGLRQRGKWDMESMENSS